MFPVQSTVPFFESYDYWDDVWKYQIMGRSDQMESCVDKVCDWGPQRAKVTIAEYNILFETKCVILRLLYLVREATNSRDGSPS